MRTKSLLQHQRESEKASERERERVTEKKFSAILSLNQSFFFPLLTLSTNPNKKKSERKITQLKGNTTFPHSLLLEIQKNKD